MTKPDAALHDAAAESDRVSHIETLLFDDAADPVRVEEGFRLLGTPPDPELVDQVLARVFWSPSSGDGLGCVRRWNKDLAAWPLRGEELIVWLRLLELARDTSPVLLELRTKVTSLDLSFATGASYAPMPGVTDLSALRRLPRLERVCLSRASSLVGDGLADLAHLQTLRLDECGSIPSFARASLRELDVSSVGQPLGASTLRDAVSLEKLRVFATEMVGAMPPLPELRSLDVLYGIWEDLASAAALPSLSELKICLHRSTVDLQPLQVAQELRRLNVTFLGERASLGGLEGCVALEQLVYSGPSLDMLEPLRGLPLRDVIVQRSSVSSLEDLEGSSKLEALQFNEAPALRDVSHLAACRALRRLVLLSVPALSSVEGLQHCSRLRELWVSGALVDDLRPLARLEELEQLYVNDCARLRSLEPLAELPALKRIAVWGTKLSPRKIPSRLRPLLER